MKIFIYLKHFPAKGDDLNEGTRKAVHGLASGLAAVGVDTTILCEGVGDSERQTEVGYRILCFHNPKSHKDQPVSASASFTLAPSLKQFIEVGEQNDLWILNGIFHRSLASLSQQLTKKSIPYIVAPHDPYHPAIFTKNAHLKWPYWYLIERRMLQQAKAVQVLDIRHQQWLRQHKILTPVVAAPNGFSPEDVMPASTLTWRAEGTPKLFFLGRMDGHNKGLDLLLEAFKQIIKESAAQLVIQGPDWGDRQSLESQVAKAGITERVNFLGPDYQRSPAAIMLEHDIFCLPSRFEGFGLSALEAMLAGRVLLVSEVAGIAPHVQASGCGIVVNPEIASIKAGLLSLINCRPQWQAMGLKGRDYALKNLHWNTIARNVLNQYEKIGLN